MGLVAKLGGVCIHSKASCVCIYNLRTNQIMRCILMHSPILHDTHTYVCGELYAYTYAYYIHDIVYIGAGNCCNFHIDEYIMIDHSIIPYTTRNLHN